MRPGVVARRGALFNPSDLDVLGAKSERIFEEIPITDPQAGHDLLPGLNIVRHLAGALRHVDDEDEGEHRKKHCECLLVRDAPQVLDAVPTSLVGNPMDQLDDQKHHQYQQADYEQESAKPCSRSCQGHTVGHAYVLALDAEGAVEADVAQTCSPVNDKPGQGDRGKRVLGQPAEESFVQSRGLGPSSRPPEFGTRRGRSQSSLTRRCDDKDAYSRASVIEVPAGGPTPTGCSGNIADEDSDVARARPG